MRMMRTMCFAVFVAATAAHEASAEPTEAEKRTEAEAIFAQAKDFMAKKDFASACPKLEAVVKLQPLGVGAKMSLGDCYVGLGKLASARAMYQEASSLAAQANQPDRASSAQDKAQSLDARISKLTITVPPAVQSTPGLAVTRDGSDFAPALYNVVVPTDGGHHTIRATAPHMKPFESGIDLPLESGAVTVTITLVPEGAPTPAAPPSPAPAAPAPASPAGVTPQPSWPPDTSQTPPQTSFWSPLRIAGFAVAGVGLVGVAAGVGVGVAGVGKANTATDTFNVAKARGDVAGENAALVDHAAGHNQGVGGWITAGIGGAAVISGVFMIAFAPRRVVAQTGTSFLITPWVDPFSKGMVLRGSF